MANAIVTATAGVIGILGTAVWATVAAATGTGAAVVIAVACPAQDQVHHHPAKMVTAFYLIHSLHKIDLFLFLFLELFFVFFLFREFCDFTSDFNFYSMWANLEKKERKKFMVKYALRGLDECSWWRC